MKLFKYIPVLMAGLLFQGCTEYWDKHYNTQPETVNRNMWEAVQEDPELSLYVAEMKRLQLDTLFDSSDTYALFAPVNTAMTQLAGNGEVTSTLLSYMTIPHFVQLVNVEGRQKIQTLSEKYALFERSGDYVSIDGIRVRFESPLYLNGKYFKMNSLVVPKPNLYEFIAMDNPILREFIDSRDSVILDKEKSRPLGFDEEGNTIYDSVSVVVNTFEYRYDVVNRTWVNNYFPVSEEFRNVSATIVFPKWEKYSLALDQMAQNLGGPYKSHTDIPQEWQNEALIPHLLEHGIFLNMLEVDEFLPKHAKDTVKLQNIQGDSVIINYIPNNLTVCSNGYFYDYTQYEIPDSLYAGKSRTEGEWLVRETGINKFSWRDSVRVISSTSFEPVRELITGASNDSIVKVNFPKGYAGSFSVEFKTPRLFPRSYLMVVRTHMDIGGKYNIYVNDQLVRTFEYYDYVKYRGVITGVTGVRYVPEGRFNRFDCLVTNISEYGMASVRFEYVEANRVPNNGLVIDYIDFIPN